MTHSLTTESQRQRNGDGLTCKFNTIDSVTGLLGPPARASACSSLRLASSRGSLRTRARSKSSSSLHLRSLPGRAWSPAAARPKHRARRKPPRPSRAWNGRAAGQRAVALRAIRIWFSVAPPALGERGLQRSCWFAKGPGCWAVDLGTGGGSTDRRIRSLNGKKTFPFGLQFKGRCHSAAIS